VKHGYDIVVLKYVRMYISIQAWTGPEGSRRLRLSAGANLGLGRLGSCLGRLLITTIPFHSLTERYSMNVDGNFN